MFDIDGKRISGGVYRSGMIDKTMMYEAAVETEPADRFLWGL